MAIRDEGARYVAAVENVESSGPGEFPSVDIRVTTTSGDTTVTLGMGKTPRLGWSSPSVPSNFFAKAFIAIRLAIAGPLLSTEPRPVMKSVLSPR